MQDIKSDTNFGHWGGQCLVISQEQDWHRVG